MSESPSPSEASEARSEPHGPRRRALITGASSGIGEAFARRLARDGYDLTLVARGVAALEALAKELRESRGVAVEVLAADLTAPDELHAVEVRVAAEPVVDLLVNNAGFGTAGPFAASEIDREEQEIRLNVLALVRLSRAALGVMLARGSGALINVSSLAALQPYPFGATYAATKAFVNSFTEALYEELRGSGVRVQVLCPGFTRTRFQETAGIDADSVPRFAWMESEAVVDASLAGLERGELVCVPGAGYRALALATGIIPRGVARRAMGLLQARRHKQ